MFGFWKKREQPPLRCKSNPGLAAGGRIAFSGVRSRVESFDLVDLAEAALQRAGFGATVHELWLDHSDSGFMLLPQLVSAQPRDDGGVQMCTTMQINHRTFAPRGVFEYQHAGGDSVEQAVSNGFDQWIKTDFVTLLDALEPQPKSCTAMEMALPADARRPARVRRAVLGPIAHFVQQPPPSPPGGEEDHVFCPCCLLTKTFDAYKPFMEADGVACVRLFAAREPDGTPQADCRVNGDDWERGAEALRGYATTWVPAGYEFRKQYVVIHDFQKR
jgi:hypothetical protein